jgi:hypothetical protein
MAFCPHCGKEISDDATVCSACEKEIEPPAQSVVAKFKGTILMPGADALKHLQPTQPAQAQKDAESKQRVEKVSEPSRVEADPQGAKGPDKPKRGFQATILGTGPMVAKAMSAVNKEQTSSATVLQSASARPPSNKQGVSSPSTTSSPPLTQKGGTMVAGSIPLPIAPESKPVEAPQHSAAAQQANNAQSFNVSGIGKTELAVPQMSMPVSETQEPASAEGEVPILKQPEEFDVPLRSKKKKSNLGMWLAVGCFGMLLAGAVVSGIAYFLLF